MENLHYHGWRSYSWVVLERSALIDGGNMTTTPVPVILGPCAPLSNLRSSDRSWWDHTTRGRRHGRPTLFPGGRTTRRHSPPHTRCYFPSPRMGALRCAYSLSLATKGRARMTVARP